jgi:hypothetical protein
VASTASASISLTGAPSPYGSSTLVKKGTGFFVAAHLLARLTAEIVRTTRRKAPGPAEPAHPVRQPGRKARSIAEIKHPAHASGHYAPWSRKIELNDHLGLWARRQLPLLPPMSEVYRKWTGTGRLLGWCLSLMTWGRG